MSPSVEGKLPFVICGVIDADCCYYLLIAPHFGSSAFEDQSSCMRLSVPTLIKPTDKLQ